MTATSDAQPRVSRRRKLLLGAALLVMATAGVAVYLTRLRQAPPLPPEGAHDGLEPAVVDVVRSARDRVLKEPHSATAWGTLGEVFLANELEEESTVCFAQAERLDPTNPRWPYYRAGSLLNQGDPEGALLPLRRAVERCGTQDPTSPHLLLGETLLTLGQLEEAEEHFRLALARQTEDPRGHFDLGLLAISRQDWDTARTHLLRCLGSPSARQKARIQLAFVCSRLGDLTSADDFQQQAGRLPKDLDWVDPFITEYMRWAVKKRDRYRLVENLEAAGRYTEAAALLQPMTEEFPEDYLPHLTLGKMLGRTGDYARAEPVLRKALRLAPDKVQVHHYLSLVLFTKAEALSRQKDEDPARARGVYQESADFARQALALKPDYGLAHMSLGLALKRLGQRAEAVAALRQAVRCTPEYAELHFYLGEALAEDGQTAEARTRLEQALRLAEPDAPWRPAARTCLDSLPADGGRKQDRPGKID
jgi:tetratricopeptide (TPR) repeat protein